MRKINNQLFVDLTEHLNMNTFSMMEDLINFNIAKNIEHSTLSQTPQSTLMNQSLSSSYEMKSDPKIEQLKESGFSGRQWDTYIKLNSGSNLGTNLSLRVPKVWPDVDGQKITKDQVKDRVCSRDFQFLYDWIDQQNCFKDYGRVTFWLAEQNQKTTYHLDYPYESNIKNQFIWLTGKNRKKLCIYDQSTSNEFISEHRALTFDTRNFHCGLGHPDHFSWSLRIDGIFEESWMEKVGIKSHFE